MSHAVGTSQLEEKVGQLKTELERLSAPNDWQNLIHVMRRPGWTTPAEWIFAETLLDHMVSQIGALASLKTRLIKGSEAVVAK